VSSAKPDLGGGRFCEVDAIKGVGIALVVLIHSLRTTWDPGITSAEIWLGYVTRFAVPGFFAASGYLYATNRPIPRRVIGRRLLRVFVPYLVASAAAQIFFLVSSVPSPERPLWRVILLASSFGAYYFVLMLALFIALSPGLARMGRRAVGFLLIPLLLVQVLIETGIVPPVNFFWHLRNPFLWAAYFVLGWWVRLHREAIVSALCAQRARWVGFVGGVWITLATVLAFGKLLPQVGVSATAWLMILTSLGFGFVLSAEREFPPSLMRPLRWLSDASYPVYLFHLFFLTVAAQEIRMASRVFEPEKLFALWLCGMVGPIVIVSMGRKLLGPRSRILLGG
jgi:fucose 4-O-acetylase-like acetyltransferase